MKSEESIENANSNQVGLVLSRGWFFALNVPLSENFKT